jgi:anti-anti-sigma factor
MHETQTEVTPADSGRAMGREAERPAIAALTVRAERRTERHADVVVLWLSGLLDHDTAPVLDHEFEQAAHARHVIMDLTSLELIDSSGLEALVRSHRRASENDRRMSLRPGRHAGRLPAELTRARRLRTPPPARCSTAKDVEELCARHGVR